MKAMNFNKTGDSVFYTRLLSYLHSYSLTPKKVEHLRGHVYRVDCKNHPTLIVKGFDSQKKYDAQIKLTSLLRKKGFTKTYILYDQFKPFTYKKRVYGIIEYISSSRIPFHFLTKKNRQEGLQLLNEFHSVSEKILPAFKGKVPLFNQIWKWNERLAEFKTNLPVIGQFVDEDILINLIKWGEWALAGMKKNEDELYIEKSVIIHGDCANHNFLRKEDGSLTLIDFDLIAIAPPMIDYLQYANRIFSYLEYPSDSILNDSYIGKYRDNQFFLYALTFPSDIFREWNRLVKEDRLSDTALHAVWKMTVEKFQKRIDFNREMARILDGGNN
jgi:thiamine kinase-like enzyme